METRPIFILLALLVVAGAFADVYYTWTDENGIVHYSDLPHPGAKRVELGQNSVSRPRPTTRPVVGSQSRGGDGAETATTTGYESLEVASPSAEETLWNIEATLTVTLALTPALKPGHQVRVYFDGTPQMVGGTSFQLQEVYRGVHNLQAEVIDATGKLIIRSRPSRFYVQQNTVQ